MNKIIAVLALAGFGLAACAVVTAVSAAVLQPTVDTSAQKLVDHMVEPDPLGDVLAVREQTQNQSGKWWAFIALLLIGGLAFAGMLVAMGRFPKAARAFRQMRKPIRQQQRPYPNSRVLPHQPVDDLPALPRLPGARAVPEMEEGYWNEQ
ncbi:MAG: hypothetical protein H6661_13935 [Ardenticatenaceae bacterium]|nr:hypothetical protein [Ardenticatenaceae bacterium]